MEDFNGVANLQVKNLHRNTSNIELLGVLLKSILNMLSILRARTLRSTFNTLVLCCAHDTP